MIQLLVSHGDISFEESAVSIDGTKIDASLSKPEGQIRSATDIELKAISQILGVSVEKLLQEDNP